MMMAQKATNTAGVAESISVPISFKQLEAGTLTRYAGNPTVTYEGGTWKGRQVHYPFSIINPDDSTQLIWFYGGGDITTDQKFSIGRATSLRSHPKNWTEYEDNPVIHPDDFGLGTIVGPSDVWYNEAYDRLELHTQCWSIGLGSYHEGLFYSTDLGFTWTYEGPTLEASDDEVSVGNVAIIRESSIWYMYYCYRAGWGVLPGIRVATSTNHGGTWTKTKKDIVVKGEEDTYNDAHIEGVTAFKMGQTYVLNIGVSKGTGTAITYSCAYASSICPTDGFQWSSINPFFEKNSSGWDSTQVSTAIFAMNIAPWLLFYQGSNTAGDYNLAQWNIGLAELNVSSSFDPTDLGEISTPAAANPTLLTWDKVSEKYYHPYDDDLEYFHLIDPNNIHYNSIFPYGFSGVSSVSGTTPTVNVNLKVNGTSLMKTHSKPKVAWFSIEMILSSMGASGSVGPALVKDTNNYISCFYDKTANQFKAVKKISGTSTTLFTIDPVVEEWGSNTSNLRLVMILQRNVLCMWIKEDGELIKLVATVELTDIDFTTNNFINDWYYGIYCDTGVEHDIASLRGGASGGAGFFNNRFMEYVNGKPYEIAGKRLFTADYTSFGKININYVNAATVLFLEDKETYEVETLTRIYVRRNDGSGMKICSAQDSKLTVQDDGTVMFVYVSMDVSDGSLVENDKYIFLPLEQVLGGGEIIINDADMSEFGFYDSPSGLYDTKAVKIDGVCYVAATISFGTPNPVVYYGPSWDNLSAKYTFDDAIALESVQIAWLGGIPYWLYATFGASVVRVFTLNLTPVGYLQLPAGTGTRIAGYGFVYNKVGDNTEYICSGFDVQEVAPTDLEGVPQFMPWTMGRKVDYKADQISIGHEFI